MNCHDDYPSSYINTSTGRVNGARRPMLPLLSSHRWWREGEEGRKCKRRREIEGHRQATQT